MIMSADVIVIHWTNNNIIVTGNNAIVNYVTVILHITHYT